LTKPCKEQFPKEINDRRKALWPFFQEACRQNKKTYLKRDRLFIDGVEFVPSENEKQRRVTNVDERSRQRFEQQGARPRHSQRKTIYDQQNLRKPPKEPPAGVENR